MLRTPASCLADFRDDGVKRLLLLPGAAFPVCPADKDNCLGVVNRFCFVSFETFPIHISGLFSHGDPGKGRCVSKIAVLWANNGEHAKNGHFWHFIEVKFPVSDFQ